MRAVGSGSPDARTILLVEDDPSVRTLLRRMLEHGGYAVVEAGNPSEALQISGDRSQSLAAVVTDFVIPEMDGAELVERIRLQQPGLPVLYISGYMKSNVPERRFSEPGAAFLQKPFSGDALLAALTKLLAPDPDSSLP